MATKVEDVYDAIVSIIEGQLTGYRRIPNPYFLDLNSHLLLQKGFGIRVDSARDAERTVSCQIFWERLFVIILTKQITTTENDIDKKELLEKSLLVDHDTLVKAFYANTAFTVKGFKAGIKDDSGIQPFVTDAGKFLSMDLSLFVEYSDTIP